MSRARFGMVMIEFTLAAVGIVAIAFMTVRVGQWLNDSMVDRNTSFQATRASAGHGPGVTAFAGPTKLTLIGPASQTPSQGTPGGGQSTVTPTCGAGLLNEANAKRSQAANLLWHGQAFTLPEQSDITYINNAVNWPMLVEANYLALHAITVDNIRLDFINRIYPRLHEIQDLPIVQGEGEHNICNFSNNHPLPAEEIVGGYYPLAGHYLPDLPALDLPGHNNLCPLQEPKGIHQIDERLTGIANELNPNVEGTVGWEWNLLSPLPWKIITDLYALIPPDANNPDYPNGTLAWQIAATWAALIGAQAACAGGSVFHGETPYPVTVCFGVIDEYHPPPNGHTGTDFGAPLGTPIYPFLPGTVQEIYRSDVNCIPTPVVCPSFPPYGRTGNTVVINHGEGLTTVYAHMDTIPDSLSYGQPVTVDMSVGTVGNTGYSDGAHLHFELRANGFLQNPIPGCNATSTSADLGGPANVNPGNCDEALIEELDETLNDEETGLRKQWENLKAVGEAINDRLAKLQPVYYYLLGELWGLWGPYMESSGGWGLYPQAFNYLDQVDGIVNMWNPLWQQLHSERPADFPSDELWDEDLSDLFRDTVADWDEANANSDETVVLEQIPDDLDVIIGRLLLLMRERLDHTDWSELPWFMGSTDYVGVIPEELRDRFSRFGVPLTSDDSVNPGGQREANARVKTLVDHPFIEQNLVKYNDDIREKILEAEELERKARRDCTSQPDP
ncbi:MAG: M23 family metallopeptidase [Candidatus Omnitrophota bacterium]|nr:M23 family metallopeptidase [Candidatus Omnitrophota bacterium]